MAATVESAFVLLDRASGPIRDIRRELRGLDDDAKAAGRSMDDLSGPRAQRQLDAIIAKTRGLGTEASRTASAVDRIGSPQQVARLDALERKLGTLGGRMDAVSRKDISPTVTLEGFADVSAKLAALQRQADDLGRSTARIRVSSSSPAPTGVVRSQRATGGVPILSGTSRDALFRQPGVITSLPGDGGRGPLGLRPAVVGGGSSGGGFPALPGGALGAVALAAVPLVGVIPPLLGSAAGAGIGAGALGIGGAGVLGAGGIAFGSVLQPAKADIQQLNTLQTAYLQQVALHGAGSKQAQTAQAKVNYSASLAPNGTLALLQQNTLLKHAWDSATGPGQSSLTTAGANILAQARIVSPITAGVANQVTAGMGEQATNLAGFATGPQMLLAYRDLAGQFTKDLPIIENTAEHMLGAFTNIARASGPFFREGLLFIDSWSMKVDQSTTGIDHQRQVIGTYVNDLKAWGHLTGDTWNLIRDLIMPGRTQGTSLVDDLSHQLEKWDQWAKLNPGRIQAFYHEAIDSTKQLAGLIGALVKDLFSVAQILTPVLGQFAQLGSIAGGAGLLLPTALRFGLGKVMGGASGGAAASAGGMLGGGLVPIGVGKGGVVAGGGLTAAERYAAGDWTGWTAAGSTALSRGAQIGAGAAKIASGVGRFALPVEALSAALGAATTQGNALERAQGGFSAPSFGLVPLPTTRAEARAQGEAQAIAKLQALGSPQNAADYQTQIGQVQAQLNAAQAKQAADNRSKSGGPSFLGGLGLGPLAAPVVGPVGAIVGGATGLINTLRGDSTAKDAVRNAGAVDKYSIALRTLRGEQAAYLKDQAQRHGVASQIHGLMLADSFQQAFGILTPSKGPERALEETLKRVVNQVTKLGPEGAKSLTAASIQWADAVSQGNPAMQRIVEQMTSGIERRFSQMGKHITVVNGQVLDGSTTEWKGIAAALTTPAEKAREEVSASFTAIQQQAVGSLVAMGYSQAAATGIVKTGQFTSAAAASQVGGTLGNVAVQSANLAAIGPTAFTGTAKKKRARGGRLPGFGLQDTVPMSDGGYGAPGELVLNRHTEADIDRDLRALGRPTLGERVASESRKHSDPMPRPDPRVKPQAGIMPGLAKGGRLPGLAGFGNISALLTTSDSGVSSTGARGGKVANLAAMIAAANAIDSRHFPYLWGGGHNSSFSPPYDCSGAWSALLHAGGVLGSPVVSGDLANMFDPGPGEVTLYANAGHVYGSIDGHFWGTSTDNPGGGAGWFNGSARPGFAVRHVPVDGGGGPLGAFSAGIASAGGIGSPAIGALRSPGSRLGGVPGALSSRASQIYAGALTQAINAHIAGGGAGVPGPISSTGGIMAIAQAAAAAEGVPWNASLVSALLSKESGGGRNLPPYSYGGGLDPAGPFQVIGSTFNEFKVPGHGDRMNPTDNALAAFHYIKSRYGSLESLASSTGLLGSGYKGYSQGGRQGPAWGGWNARGGDFMVNRPTVFGAGENGPERVTITPKGQPGHTVTIQSGAVQIHGQSSAWVQGIVQTELEGFAKRVHAHITAGPEENEGDLIA